VLKLFKLFLIFCVLYFSSLSFPKIVLSQEQFNVGAGVTYNFQESGKAVVTHDISLENLFSTLYATTYTLSLDNVNAQNISASDENGKAIPAEVKKESDKTVIKVVFNTPVVGKGAKRRFSISYENDGLAARTGEVWEVSIPRLSEQSSFSSYSVSLVVPHSYGQEAYVSPKPSESHGGEKSRTYSFDKNSITQAGITAGFGQFQVFSFSLSYHLENPLPRAAVTEVALPPDTAFQKVYFESISPKPTDVSIDADGNWMATYKLNPRERMDIVATGTVQIFASFRPFPKPDSRILSDNLKEQDFWQVNDPQIKSLAAELKTPRAIYDYVTRNLKYDLNRVKPNVQRAGAMGALASPDQAICMEFTDLFIAISRTAGIPAREVNGYAYTENPDLQPLGLVADVLHAWPEYYDSASGAWIPVDPTWGSTTGSDFFTKLDLRHFTFVIHGESSTRPYAPGSYKLGANPQKDVFVSFGKLNEDRNSIPVLTAETKRLVPFLDSLYSVTITNPGPSAIYSLYPTVFFDSQEKSRDFVEIMPPYSKYSMTVAVPFSILGKNTPDKIRIAADGSQVEIPTNKTQIIINSLLVLFLLFFILLILVLFKLKKITFSVIIDKIAALIDKIYGKFNRISNKNPPVS
jgi:transglutaminase-like putative cysteine protease